MKSTASRAIMGGQSQNHLLCSAVCYDIIPRSCFLFFSFYFFHILSHHTSLKISYHIVLKLYRTVYKVLAFGRSEQNGKTPLRWDCAIHHTGNPTQYKNTNNTAVTKPKKQTNAAYNVQRTGVGCLPQCSPSKINRVTLESNPNLA